MDGGKPNSNLDSWSIPKRKAPPLPSQDRPSGGASRPLDMAIPKKKKPYPGNGNSMNMAIPRRHSGSSPGGGIPPPKKRPSLDASIPKRQTSGGGYSGFNPSFDKVPVPRRNSFETAAALVSMHQGSVPRKKHSLPSSSSSSSFSNKPHKQKQLHPPPHPQSNFQSESIRPPRRGVHITSEFPFILKVPLKGVPLTEGIPRFRSSTRTPKRVRQSYKEVDDTDSDDFLTDSDEDTRRSSSVKKKKNKLKRVSKVGSSSSATSAAAASAAASLQAQNAALETGIPSTALLALNNTSLDAPPAGTLNTLWYSRECFLHVLVVEKIIAWKTRHVTQLEWDPATLPSEGGPNSPPTIDAADAAKWSGIALTNPTIWSDPSKRMEVSRLVPERCPTVMAMGCQAQSNTVAEPVNAAGTAAVAEMVPGVDPGSEIGVKKEPGTGTPKGPQYRLKKCAEDDREEVYLVKWRGRSHLHASWERGSDIIKYDQSNNTARHKIRRFVQSQEIAFGKDWKRVLEEERATSATIHAHGEQSTQSDADTIEEEYYPPSVTEIERILACDESEMNMDLFAKQRGLNIKEEQDQVRRKEAGTVQKWNSKEGLEELLKEIPWDPEDNVRYVVKWKGLPFAEMTWEYWRDIKADAVNEAEDFWLRQKPPDPSTVSHLVTKSHPHISEFRKIQESPAFGLSERERRVADVGQTKEEDDGNANTGFRLRAYQLEGVNWLLFNWWNRRSCILADEMGLGKTIQSMCFLKSLQDLPATEVRGPFLIVAPLSLIGQWQSEARSWAPDLNIVLYHGSADARDFLVKQDFFYTDQFVPKPTALRLKKQHITKFHILITTYEVVLKDVNVFSKIKWRALIVDEAHRLKNPKSRLFEDLGTVPRDFCLLLTGTPLANATEELWALLHFADKNAFADKEDFLEKFGQLTDADQVNELHTILKPYLLRRVKEDVEKSLPPKEETILEVSLTPIQKKYYKAIYERNTTFLYKGAKPSNSPSLMNVMMELRKCCNHPYLVRGAEERILADAASQIKRNGVESTDSAIDQVKLFGEQLIKSSGKMVLINKLLPKLFSNGHKVLIFSQMVRVLDLLEELLKMMKYKYERLDGSTSSSSRAAAVDRFCRKSCQRFVMLLSTRAGGLGLNLTAADIVIIFDSDWNPQNDLQAMARAHRIGQTRAVRVYRLLTAKTYEMHMFHSASMKLGLERAVLSQQREHTEEGESGKSKTKSEKEAQAKEIDSLLKKGAYDVFKEEDDTEAQKFMETDIDQLLESNAQTVTYGKDESTLSSGLGSFSKASFVTDTGDGDKDVDLDDPDFWKKAAGLEAPVETPEDVAQMLDDGVKRSRKQVQVFDPFADFAEIEQRKEDKKMQKIREEKEEKERVRVERKMKKIQEKEKRKREKEEMRGSLFGKSKIAISRTKPETKFKIKRKEQLPLPTSKKTLKMVKEKPPKEPKIKKPKKSGERRRGLKRAQNEDPVVERLKQAWDIPQRNRAVASCLRFGFDRFCKIRSEANLTSLPVQDIELFFRSYFYQLSLQLVVSFMQMLKENNAIFNYQNIKSFLKECLGILGGKEVNWLSDCISNGMKFYLQIEQQRRYLRLPVVLAEPGFVSELRRGAAMRSLRRIFVMSRVHRIIEDGLDGILSELGYEQLGKRGCPTSNLSAMDSDLKARLVSTEELSLAISTQLRQIKRTRPVAWWDRSCDIALVIGTFVHGLGNYEAMQNDDSFPFGYKIGRYARADEACAAAQKRFAHVANATRKVFHDALEAAKIKDQLQIQAAVAAAAAASSKREKEALAMREGGEAADAVVSNIHETPADKLYETDGDDSHFVTLPRLKKMIQESIRSDRTASAAKPDFEISTQFTMNGDSALVDGKGGRRKSHSHHALAMPDARILDCRLSYLLSEIESHTFPDEASCEDDHLLPVPPTLWPSSEVVRINNKVQNRALSYVLDLSPGQTSEQSFEHMGIGLHGTQCGSTHRSLDDGSDFFIGAANADLAQVAHGSDAPRYLRAIGVPMNMTRFAVSAIVHADSHCIKSMLEGEKIRNLIEDVHDEELKNDQGEEGEAAQQNEKKEDQKASAERETNDGMKSETPSKAFESSDSSEKVESREDNADMAHPKLETQLESKTRIPKVFIRNAELRACVCAVVLHYGFPFKHDENIKIFKPLWKNIREHCVTFDDSPADSLFQPDRFLSLVRLVASDDIEIPEFAVVNDYVLNCLLPHCLRLCLMGNGPTLDNARGSKGEYETAFGISLYPEPTENLQCSLPDPSLPLEEHSVEALASGFAILRRAQLMRSAMELATGKLPMEELDAVLRSSFMRKSMDGLPVWWCPWIHDAALLVHATTHGLFSIMRDRKFKDHAPLAFSQEKILQHLQSTFVEDDTALPRAVVDSALDDSQEWIEHHAGVFPSMNVLERRLAFLCAKATESQNEEGTYYDNLPMFDHGAWPRN